MSGSNAPSIYAPRTPAEGETARWHALSPEECCLRLGVDPQRGLTSADVARRLTRWGPNELVETKGRALWRMVLGQFTDALIAILLAAALISGWLGEMADTLTILVIILLNAVIGVVQEYRAQTAVAELKRLAAPQVNVRRNGVWSVVPAEVLLPGDIVLLEAGDCIAADMRLLETAGLECDESTLTGESLPVAKIHTVDIAAEAALPNRRTLVHRGTWVTRGRASAVVVATGMRTELGQIARLLSATAEVQTPLQRRLAHFGRRLALAVVLICVALFAAGVTRGEPILTMFLTALSLAVAAIPEALPAVVSVALALGARRMAQENALVRRLPAVETLGSVTYVCSDKTGTLTQNQMHVEQVVLAGTIRRVEDLCVADEQAAVLLRAMALNSDVQRGVDGRFRGDPTETALRAAAEAAGLDVDDLQQRYARVHELPFDSDRKMMTTFHRVDRAVVAYTKGAPEAVFAQCANTPAQSLSIVEWSQAAQALAGEGYRVLAFARRCWETLPPGIGSAQAETGLELVGLAALVDPPRAEAAAAVAACRKAGITPVMITGDHASTARTIAIRLGILDQGGRILTGEQLAAISAQDFAQVVDKVRVYARVTPQQKIDIVQALQARGEFVAMTGDGVNDAPALKRADIGVAMGERGTDVARESSQLVLLDDNFATIVAAVAEGRRIYDNVRKFIKYTMTSNSGEIWTIALAPLLGLPIPLLPIHILWINLVTDGLPGLALANEPPEKDLMARPPRLPAESVFAHGMWQHMLWVGLLMGGTSLAAQVFAMSVGWTNWQTIVFTVLTFSQLGHALAIRSDKQSLFSQGLFSNRALALSVGLIVLLQLATIYVTSLNAIFRTEALSLPQLLFCLAMSSVVFVAVELEKAWRRRGSMQR